MELKGKVVELNQETITHLRAMIVLGRAASKTIEDDVFEVEFNGDPRGNCRAILDPGGVFIIDPSFDPQPSLSTTVKLKLRLDELGQTKVTITDGQHRTSA
jgi:hypothetical protein